MIRLTYRHTETEHGSLGAVPAVRSSAARTLFVPVVAMASCLILPPVGRHEAAEEPKKIAGSDWPMAAKDYANTRYSELDQINTENVKDLKLAWTFDTGVHRGQEAAPIVVGDTMYVVTPFPNILYALDLTKPGDGEVEVRAEARRRSPRASPAATSSTAAPSSPTAGSSINTLDCHVCRRGRRAPARSSGRRRSATSTWARR